MTGTSLSLEGGELVCHDGRKYPIVDGIPILLNPDVSGTHNVFEDSLLRSHEVITEWEERGWLNWGENDVHPFIQAVVAATSGYLYRNCIGSLGEYPIPRMRLPESGGSKLIDVGCNWGRWSVAASRLGYQVVGVDPSLEGILAAREMAKQMNVKISLIVGDARFLPLLSNGIDHAFSYSVLQHLSHEDARSALDSMNNVLRPGGRALVQMPNAYGVRSVQHQLKRRFRSPTGFQVRYYTPQHLKNVFVSTLGPSRLSVDGFFGLGIQPSDIKLFSSFGKCIVRSSEFLRKISSRVPFLTKLADSLYVESVTRDSGDD